MLHVICASKSSEEEEGATGNIFYSELPQTCLFLSLAEAAAVAAEEEDARLERRERQLESLKSTLRTLRSSRANGINQQNHQESKQGGGRRSDSLRPVQTRKESFLRSLKCLNDIRISLKLL